MRYAMGVTGRAQIAKTKNAMAENGMNGEIALLRWGRSAMGARIAKMESAMARSIALQTVATGQMGLTNENVIYDKRL